MADTQYFGTTRQANQETVYYWSIFNILSHVSACCPLLAFWGVKKTTQAEKRRSNVDNLFLVLMDYCRFCGVTDPCAGGGEHRVGQWFVCQLIGKTFVHCLYCHSLLTIYQYGHCAAIFHSHSHLYDIKKNVFRFCSPTTSPQTNLIVQHSHINQNKYLYIVLSIDHNSYCLSYIMINS